MPGSHVVGLGEWLLDREDPPMRPIAIAPVDAALRAPGALIAPTLEEGFGAVLGICTVFCSEASIALTGVVTPDVFPFLLNEESKRSAWLLEDARVRWLEPFMGGGGGRVKRAPAVTFEGSLGLGC